MGSPPTARTTACAACPSRRSCGSSRALGAARAARTRTARTGTRRGARRGGTRDGGTGAWACHRPTGGSCVGASSGFIAPCPQRTGQVTRTLAVRMVSTPVSAAASICRSGICTSRVYTLGWAGTRGGRSASDAAFTTSARPSGTASGFSRTPAGRRRGRLVGTRTTCAAPTTTVPRSTARASSTPCPPVVPSTAGSGSGVLRPSACDPTHAGSAARRSSLTPASV